MHSCTLCMVKLPHCFSIGLIGKVLLGTHIIPSAVFCYTFQSFASAVICYIPDSSNEAVHKFTNGTVGYFHGNV